MHTIDSTRHKQLRDHLAWRFAANGDAIADMPADRADHARDVFLYVITEGDEQNDQQARSALFDRVRMFPRSTQFICSVVAEYVRDARGIYINRSRLRDLQVAAKAGER